MICISKKLTKNYAIELAFFNHIRSFFDGVTAFELALDSDFYKGDHNPKITFRLIVLNFLIFEINFYNVNHEQ